MICCACSNPAQVASSSICLIHMFDPLSWTALGRIGSVLYCIPLGCRINGSFVRDLARVHWTWYYGLMGTVDCSLLNVNVEPTCWEQAHYWGSQVTAVTAVPLQSPQCKFRPGTWLRQIGCTALEACLVQPISKCCDRSVPMQCKASASLTS